MEDVLKAIARTPHDNGRWVVLAGPMTMRVFTDKTRNETADCKLFWYERGTPRQVDATLKQSSRAFDYTFFSRLLSREPEVKEMSQSPVLRKGLV